MNNLPPEIICYIGNYLGAEKIPFSLASKTLNQVLKHDVRKTFSELRKLKKEVSYDFTILLKNGKADIVSLRNTDIIISKIKELYIAEENTLKNIRSFLEVKPVVVLKPHYYNITIRFTYQDHKSITKKLPDNLISVIRNDSVYSTEIKQYVIKYLRKLDVTLYRNCDLKKYEELINKLKELFSFLEKTEIMKN